MLNIGQLVSVLPQGAKSIPIELVPWHGFSDWLAQQAQITRTWLTAQHFQGLPDTHCIIPTEHGAIARVIVSYQVQELTSCAYVGSLASILPAGVYTIEPKSFLSDELFRQCCLNWGLQSYRFQRYKSQNSKQVFAQLIVPAALQDELAKELAAIYVVRDLINTPCEDMGPAELSLVAVDLATSFQGNFQQWIGEELLDAEFPAIYAVGKGSQNPPRLIQLSWGDPKHPLIAIVGKGVCFDTGGLNLKTGRSMLLMKKDMGGAAHALGLTQWIMSNQLPLRLLVLIPAVENAISASSYRPGDIIKTRKGMTVEIGNTDAEGRVILADALYEAAQHNPRYLIDFATLTGAARVALGTELPALFCNHDETANLLTTCSQKINDPVWRMPLHQPYRSLLASSVADINNVGDDSYGGAVLAALFLQNFVSDQIPWAHFDIMAWNLRTKPAKPEGGEAMALRTVYSFLKEVCCD